MEEFRSKGPFEQQTRRRSGRNSRIYSPLSEGNLSDSMIAETGNSSENDPLIVMTESERMIKKLQIELT